MEAVRIVGGIAFTSAFFAAGCLGSWIFQGILRNRYSTEAALLSGTEDGKAQRLLRNGLPALMPLAHLLMKASFIRRFIMRIEQTLARRHIATHPSSVATLLIGGCGCVFVIGLAIARSWVFALTGVFLCIIALNGWLGKQYDLYRSELREELPYALQAMNSCFCIGYSLPQIFDQVALDLEGPLKAVFQRCAAIINAGGTIEEALEALKHQTSEPELFFLATALEIQHRTGSSLSQVLEVVRRSVDDQIGLKRLLRTQTAQAKLSAQIVTIMPFLIIAIFSLISEGFLEPFFTSITGIVLLAVAVLMQAAGIMIVRKLLKVEVA